MSLLKLHRYAMVVTVFMCMFWIPRVNGVLFSQQEQDQDFMMPTFHHMTNTMRPPRSISRQMPKHTHSPRTEGTNTTGNVSNITNVTENVSNTTENTTNVTGNVSNTTENTTNTTGNVSNTTGNVSNTTNTTENTNTTGNVSNTTDNTTNTTDNTTNTTDHSHQL